MFLVLHSAQIGTDLKSLFDTAQHDASSLSLPRTTDIRFICDGQMIHAHSIILGAACQMWCRILHLIDGPVEEMELQRHGEVMPQGVPVVHEEEEGVVVAPGGIDMSLQQEDQHSSHDASLLTQLRAHRQQQHITHEWYTPQQINAGILPGLAHLHIEHTDDMDITVIHINTDIRFAVFYEYIHFMYTGTLSSTRLSRTELTGIKSLAQQWSCDILVTYINNLQTESELNPSITTWWNDTRAEIRKRMIWGRRDAWEWDDELKMKVAACDDAEHEIEHQRYRWMDQVRLNIYNASRK